MFTVFLLVYYNFQIFYSEIVINNENIYNAFFIATTFSCECNRTKTWIFLAPRYLLWSECFCLPQIGMLKLNPQSNGIRRWRLWDVTRAWEQNPHEWDKCPYKEVQHSTLAPFHHVKIQWEVHNQKRPLSWPSWYSDLLASMTVRNNTCLLFISNSVYGILL